MVFPVVVRHAALSQHLTGLGDSRFMNGIAITAHQMVPRATSASTLSDLTDDVPPTAPASTAELIANASVGLVGVVICIFASAFAILTWP